MGWEILAGAGATMLGQYMANQENKELARNQMDFQERMSSSAHQREVEDLKRAGLNPILSASKGASTPAGASAQMQNIAEGVGSTALGAETLKQNLVKQNADIEKQKSEIGLIQSQQKVNQGTEALQKAQTSAAESQAMKSRVEAHVLKKGIPEADFKNEVYDGVRPLIKKAKEWFDFSAKDASKMPATQEAYKNSIKLKAGRLK